jgi:serine/threonine protein kinase
MTPLRHAHVLSSPHAHNITRTTSRCCTYHHAQVLSGNSIIPAHSVYSTPQVLYAVRGKKYDGKAADVWASGVMLYTMLVGSYPFERQEDKTDPQGMRAMYQVCEYGRGERHTCDWFVGVQYCVQVCDISSPKGASINLLRMAQHVRGAHNQCVHIVYMQHLLFDCMPAAHPAG